MKQPCPKHLLSPPHQPGGQCKWRVGVGVGGEGRLYLWACRARPRERKVSLFLARHDLESCRELTQVIARLAGGGTGDRHSPKQGNPS